MNIVEYKENMGKRLLEGLMQMEAEDESSLCYIEYLTEYGADVDYQDPKTGYTPIMVAIEHNLEKSFDNILSFEPNLEAANFWGIKPIHLAAAQENQHYLRSLCKKRVDVNAFDKHGNRPLNYAIRKEAVPNIRILMKRSESLNYLNNVRKSIYDEALETQNQEVIDCVYQKERENIVKRVLFPSIQGKTSK